jgi:hypothetical protein
MTSSLVPIFYSLAVAAFCWVSCMRFEDWGTDHWARPHRYLPVVVVVEICIALGGVFGDEIRRWYAADQTSSEWAMSLGAGAVLGIGGYWIARVLARKAEVEPQQEGEAAAPRGIRPPRTLLERLFVERSLPKRKARARKDHKT